MESSASHSSRRGEINLADLATLMIIFITPFVAAMAAASEKAGWFSILFFIAGAGLGVGGGLVVRILAYSILRAATHLPRSLDWLGLPLLLAYMFFPTLAVLFVWLTVGEVSRLVAHLLFHDR